ncbi:MAG: EAL domain-containing protein [Steroidobacteraceae bacterium]
MTESATRRTGAGQDELAGTGHADSEYARMLRTLIGNLEGIVFRCRNDEPWTMEFISQGCLKLTGYAPEQLLHNAATSFNALIHPDDRAPVRERCARAVIDRSPYQLEYRLLHADGSVRWVWERGVPVFDAADQLAFFEGFIEDISERRHAEQALREAEQSYHSLFENVLEGVFRTSADGRYLMANPALARIYGYDSPAQLLGAVNDISRQIYVDPQRRAEFRRQVMETGTISGFESQVYRRDGSVIWISENARARHGADGDLQYFEGTVEEVTERRQYQARIEQQANFDALTGLANRSLLNERLQAAIQQAEQCAAQVAVAFIDLDQFKFINDTFGHQLGDQLLQTMSERLRGCVGPQDTVARQGGDEFVLLLRDCGSVVEVTRRIDGVLAAIAQPWQAGKREFQITSSIGVALYPADGRSADVLLRNADSAMYKAKDSGRNNFQFFTGEMSRMMAERLSTENRLRGALKRRQFLLHYQPRVDAHDGRIVGAEALLRWRVPQRGLVPPDKFIGLAEDTGLIVPIGAWVLDTACQQNRAWQLEGLPPVVVSVNVSARQFCEQDFVATVAAALQNSGLAPQYLQLELTESLLMRDAEQAVIMLERLKRLGVQIALDDFGTGFSSLSYLKRFPVDYLKIDRSFVTDLAHDPDDAAIVQAVIALGHKLGLKVVAEGVEDEHQRVYLAHSQCDEMQGFHLGMPMLAHDFASCLAQPQFAAPVSSCKPGR